MKSQRLNSGGLIDRSREIRFSWNQKTLRGFCGDTLSALMAGTNKAGF